MTPSPYFTRSRAAATSAPPPGVTVVLTCCCQVVIQLHPCEVPTPAVKPPASPVPARVVNPLASPVALPSPLEPLFLGMDDDTVIPSPLASPPLARVEPDPVGGDYSPASHVPGPHEVDGGRPPAELTTPNVKLCGRPNWLAPPPLPQPWMR
ncbi:hypothetical protein NDA14_006431 [Ustilago hordei]|nr:hypothetical protein NDA14_006431 [Ustilago hordei]UTT93723.1 hypothetical protein NDA17_006443 [Ustilago hordei]